MFAVVYGKVFSELVKSHSDPAVGVLLGRRVNDEELIHIVAATEKNADAKAVEKQLSFKEPEVVGIYVASRTMALDEMKEYLKNLARAESIFEGSVILLAAWKDAKLSSTMYVLTGGSLHNIEYMTASFESQLFERIHGLVQIETLSTKTVVIVGLGTGGSTIALELAKCGVGKFKLLDYDRVEVHNLARHVCGISDLGMFKTHAVKNKILEHSPQAMVETYEIDVLKSKDTFERILSVSDLVVAATGSPAVNNLTNELCLRHKIPAVYGGVWERGMGGYVMRVIPEKTACYNCVHEALLKNAPPLDKSRVINYTSISDPNELKAEPGLSIDVNIVSLIQAKLSLSLLLSIDKAKDDIPQDYVMWFNKSYDRFKPLTCLKAHISRRDDCAICNYENWLKRMAESEKEPLKQGQV